MLLGNGTMLRHAQAVALAGLICCSLISDTGAKDYNKEPVFRSQSECRFLHIINDFKPHDANTTLEFDIVFQSMKTAQAQARAAGIQVDFVFVLQDGDELSVPRSDLLDAVYVTEAFLDPASQRSLPTPGGILDAGLAHHDHPAVVFTNRDIGLYPQFYVQSCEFLQVPGQLVVETTRVLLNMDEVVEDYNRTLYAKGRVHRGADCWVMAREVLPDCYREDRRLVVGFPPWGSLLRHILYDHAVALRCGQIGGYRISRSSPHTPSRRRTFHLERAEGTAPWKKMMRYNGYLYAYLQMLPRRVMLRAPKLAFIESEDNIDCSQRGEPMVWPWCEKCHRPCDGFWMNCPTADCQVNGPRCRFDEQPALATCPNGFNKEHLTGPRDQIRAVPPISLSDHLNTGITA
ncbi:uncharacterized protein MONBRDRAFT_32394 [Monosiga brevicollis MX1]|uniref:Uncharacterized protein n=1 Tax=Monosiga brevicollis TaxID=81824 RepID=A9UZ91_MONBE|nr:uncharacterized protein MONBRDRAFT_32394 [Monosiga brevicollis MX1]EDQ89325.1 predicted protein [Monosiga brevicollis MX1]|eukprot:XP_001745901.1 hypothetical protein [Monosiga brevicollis MX1]